MKAKRHTAVQVTVIPSCDLCGGDPDSEHAVPAKYDARIIGLGWANVCQRHFDIHSCTLGLGNGQELTLEDVEWIEDDRRSAQGKSTLAMMVELFGDEDEVLMMADDMGMTDLFE